MESFGHDAARAIRCLLLGPYATLILRRRSAEVRCLETGRLCARAALPLSLDAVASAAHHISGDGGSRRYATAVVCDGVPVLACVTMRLEAADAGPYVQGASLSFALVPSPPAERVSGISVGADPSGSIIGLVATGAAGAVLHWIPAECAAASVVPPHVASRLPLLAQTALAVEIVFRPDRLTGARDDEDDEDEGSAEGGPSAFVHCVSRAADGGILESCLVAPDRVGEARALPLEGSGVLQATPWFAAHTVVGLHVALSQPAGGWTAVLCTDAAAVDASPSGTPWPTHHPGLVVGDHPGGPGAAITLLPRLSEGTSLPPLTVTAKAARLHALLDAEKPAPLGDLSLATVAAARASTVALCSANGVVGRAEAESSTWAWQEPVVGAVRSAAPFGECSFLAAAADNAGRAVLHRFDCGLLSATPVALLDDPMVAAADGIFATALGDRAGVAVLLAFPNAAPVGLAVGSDGSVTEAPASSLAVAGADEPIVFGGALGAEAVIVTAAGQLRFRGGSAPLGITPRGAALLADATLLVWDGLQACLRVAPLGPAPPQPLVLPSPVVGAAALGVLPWAGVLATWDGTVVPIGEREGTGSPVHLDTGVAFVAAVGSTVVAASRCGVVTTLAASASGIARQRSVSLHAAVSGLLPLPLLSGVVALTNVGPFITAGGEVSAVGVPDMESHFTDLRGGATLPDGRIALLSRTAFALLELAPCLPTARLRQRIALQGTAALVAADTAASVILVVSRAPEARARIELWCDTAVRRALGGTNDAAAAAVTAPGGFAAPVGIALGFPGEVRLGLLAPHCAPEADACEYGVRLPGDATVVSMAFTDDGARLLVLSRQAQLFCVDAASQVVSKTIVLPPRLRLFDPVPHVAASCAWCDPHCGAACIVAVWGQHPSQRVLVRALPDGDVVCDAADAHRVHYRSDALCYSPHLGCFGEYRDDHGLELVFGDP